MPISVGDHAVFAAQDIFLPDDSPEKIPPKIDDRLVAGPDIPAVDHPLSLGNNSLK
jgi:hypothetical protein